MERIVGKLWLFLLLVMCSTQAQIRMRVSDEEGAQLEAVGVGRPFMLHIELSNLTSGMREPKIEHLDAFEHYRTGVQMTTVNGSTTATYSYQCRIDTAGNHLIGPATIPGTQEQSAPLAIVAAQEPQYTRASKKEESQVLFRISAQPESVVMGQKLVLRAKFYTSDSRFRLQNMTVPNLPAFRVIDKKGPTFGREKINGINYEYSEWVIELFAQRPGIHCIPALSAEYEYPSASKYSLFSWGHFAQMKRVYSNSLSVRVEKLPGSQDVIFIGSQATAHAGVNQVHAKMAEGILYTITIRGDGDIEAVQLPPLATIPEGLKIYESKTSVIPGTSGQLPQKQFEYVVQGVKEGSWEIPAQHYTVFDVDEHAYKTISTGSIRLAIAGDPLAKPSGTQNSFQQKKDEASAIAKHNAAQDEGPLAPINQHDPWYPTPERAPISWALFFTLVFAPCAYGIMTGVRKKVAGRSNPQKRMKHAIQDVVSKLERAQKEKKFAEIYPLLRMFFATIFDVPEAQISADMIAHRLADAGQPVEVIQMWREFFKKITECAFGWQTHADDAELWSEARRWVHKWKDLV